MRSNQFPLETCGRDLCPWTEKGCKTRCFKENINYIAQCSRCVPTEDSPPTLYFGETSRSLVNRMGGHLRDYKRAMKSGGGSSWMADHSRLVHNGSWNKERPQDDYKFQLSGTYQKPLERQVGEFVAIRMAKATGQAWIGGKLSKVTRTVHNTKEEWWSHIGTWDCVG